MIEPITSSCVQHKRQRQQAIRQNAPYETLSELLPRKGSTRGIGVEADRAMKNRGIKTLRHDNRQELPRITNKHSLSLHNGPHNGDRFSRTLMMYYGRKAETYVFTPVSPVQWRLVRSTGSHLFFLPCPGGHRSYPPLSDFSSFFLPEKAQCRNYRMLKSLNLNNLLGRLGSLYRFKILENLPTLQLHTFLKSCFSSYSNTKMFILK